MNLNCVLIGSVASSEDALKIMLKKNLNIEMVFSLDEDYSQNVSDYRPIHKLAEENNVPSKIFKKINDEENISVLKKINPDYIFVIGLSQLIGKEIISSAKKGVIGYHPAPLPKFRGRAAIVWQMLLGVRQSAATLFFIDEGMDSGDIICQEPYEINQNDYAQDVHRSLSETQKRLFEKGIDNLLNPKFVPIVQNEEEATYLLKRSPEDGRINWDWDGKYIHRFVRAVSRPYPGAFSSYEDKSKIIFWRADFIPTEKYYGFNGQIISVSEDCIEILCKGGKLKVTEFEKENDIKLIAGHKFC